MVSCCAVNCTNRTEKGFRTFMFPSNKERRKLWVKNCRRGGGWMPSVSTRICEVHFDESQWESKRKDGWVKLKPGAVPTIFNIPPRKSARSKRKSIEEVKQEQSSQLDGSEPFMSQPPVGLHPSTRTYKYTRVSDSPIKPDLSVVVSSESESNDEHDEPLVHFTFEKNPADSRSKLVPIRVPSNSSSSPTAKKRQRNKNNLNHESPLSSRRTDMASSSKSVLSKKIKKEPINSDESQPASLKRRPTRTQKRKNSLDTDSPTSVPNNSGNQTVPSKKSSEVATFPCAAWLCAVESTPVINGDTVPNMKVEVLSDGSSSLNTRKRRKLAEQPSTPPRDDEIGDKLKQHVDQIETLKLELGEARNEADELKALLADANLTVSKLEKTVKLLRSERSKIQQERRNELKSAESTIKKLEKEVKSLEIACYKREKRLHSDRNIEARLKKDVSNVEKVTLHAKLLVSENETVQECNSKEGIVVANENNFKSRLAVEKAEITGIPGHALRFSMVGSNKTLFQHYTGLPEYSCFTELLKWLTSDTLKYSFNQFTPKIPLEDQLLLTLMKLKLNVDHLDLAARFQISRLTSNSIFMCVATALHEILLSKMKMPPIEQSHEPLSSKLADCSNRRCIVEYTDVNLAIVGHPAAYHEIAKRRKPFRGLIACSLDGLVRFVSDMFPPSVSDDVVFNECGIIDSFEEGDLILPDGKTLLGAGIPNVLPNEGGDVALIHSKKAIGRMKRYKILESFPFGYRQHLSMIFQLVGYLMNFYNPLLNEGTGESDV